VMCKSMTTYTTLENYSLCNRGYWQVYISTFYIVHFPFYINAPPQEAFCQVTVLVGPETAAANEGERVADHR